ASDDDEDALSYSIVNGNGLHLFTMNASTGVITLVDPTRLDYESAASHALVIEVSDGWNVVRATAHIDVADVNDTAPNFEAHRFSVSELAPIGFSVGMTQATQTEVDALHYAIVEGNDDSAFA